MVVNARTAGELPQAWRVRRGDAAARPRRLPSAASGTGRSAVRAGGRGPLAAAVAVPIHAEDGGVVLEIAAGRLEQRVHELLDGVARVVPGGRREDGADVEGGCVALQH